MKIPYFAQWHASHHLKPETHDDLLYGAILVFSIPVLVVGGRFVINAIFSLFM